MADIQINELMESVTAADTDWIAIDNGSATKKISVSNFNSTGAASAAQSAAAAAQSASDAADSKAAAEQAEDDTAALITSAQTIVSNAQTYAGEAATSANSASTAASTATAQAAIATQAASTAAGYAQNVDNFAKTAKSWAVGGTGTRQGEDTDNSKYYADSAHTSEINAAASESAAATSEANAAASETAAAASESNAATSESNAASSETNAAASESSAATSASNAASSESNAATSETNAAASATAAGESEDDSEAWAWGKIDGVDVPATHPAYHNNAKYWADAASGGVSGVSSFNGRSGNVTSQSGDYAANIVEFDPSNNALISTTVQDAIEEVQGNVETLGSSLATVATTGAYSDLSGTPTLGTAAAKDVPTSGNASTAQVVLGSDTRLTDARTPVSHTHTKSEITDFPTLGTAAAKDSTNAVTQSSTDLVESGAVYTEVSTLNNALTNKDTAIESEISDVVNLLGAKNLLPNDATTQTVNGVTFTVNADGSISCSGTSTARSYITVYNGDALVDLIGERVILSGCPSGGDSVNGYDLSIIFFNNGTEVDRLYDVGEGLEITVPTHDDARIYIIAEVANIDMSYKIFYPMIRPSTITDAAYVPYAMTNRELSYDVLYRGSFQSGSVTLAKEISNYRYLELVFGNNVHRIYNRHSNSITSAVLTTHGADFANPSNKGVIFNFVQYSVSGKTFTVGMHTRMFFYKDYTKPMMDENLYGYISDIRGYR